MSNELKVMNPLSFSGQFETAQNYNDNFLRTKMKVFAFNRSANGSLFKESSLEKAKESIKLIPIVAKYNEEKEDLEGHNVKLKKNKNDEFELVFDTAPIGVVDSNTNITLEEVNEGTDENPLLKTYVVIDNVYLWKRYEATKKIQEWIESGITPKISMEIDSVQGNVNNEGFFEIENFEFLAIAALGSDVEPAFSKAEIEVYSKEQIVDEFKEMVFELKESLDQKEGGSDMPEDLKQPEEKKEIPVEKTLPEEDKKSEEEIVEPTEEKEDEKEKNKEEDPKEDKKPEEEKSTVDFQAEFSRLSESHKSLVEENLTFEKELKELRTFKRNREELDLKEQFSGKVSEEEFSQVFSEMKDSSIKEIEEKLFVLIGKKNFSLQQESTKKVNKLNLEISKDKENDSPYGDLFN